MKVLVSVLENEDQVSIDNMQFGFMPGKGTTDAIFFHHAKSTRETLSKEEEAVL